MLWLFTAMPARPSVADTLVLPTGCQVSPSLDTAAATVVPVRVSFNHAGKLTDVLPR